MSETGHLEIFDEVVDRPGISISVEADDPDATADPIRTYRLADPGLRARPDGLPGTIRPTLTGLQGARAN